VIADRTANDGTVYRQTIKPVYEWLRYARSDSTGRVYERIQTLSTQANVTNQRDSSVVHEVSE